VTGLVGHSIANDPADLAAAALEALEHCGPPADIAPICTAGVRASRTIFFQYIKPKQCKSWSESWRESHITMRPQASYSASKGAFVYLSICLFRVMRRAAHGPGWLPRVCVWSGSFS
jgi:hypothetical protein